MTVSEDKIIAYVDGELAPEDRAEVEAAAAAEPEVAAALAQHQALRRRLAGVHADVLEESVPAHLEALIRAAGPRPESAEVVDLAARRAQRTKSALRGGARPWALLAAGFAAGAVITGLFAGRPAELYATHGHVLVAEGRLARALDRDLASDPKSASGQVRVGLSFKARDGGYCRTFVTEAEAPMAGVACRKGQAWAIRTAVFNPPAPPEGDYRTAASAAPAPVLSAVQDLIDGAPLDAQAEARARARGWR
jgi:hypothetical protein